MGRPSRSVDIRAAILVPDAGEPCAVLACLRISAEPPEAIKTRYALLEDRFGPRKAKGLKILWEAAPFRKFRKICEELRLHRLSLERTPIPLSRSISLESFGASVINRS